MTTTVALEYDIEFILTDMDDDSVSFTLTLNKPAKIIVVAEIMRNSPEILQTILTTIPPGKFFYYANICQITSRDYCHFDIYISFYNTKPKTKLSDMDYLRKRIS